MTKIQRENYHKVMKIFEPMVQRYLKSTDMYDHYHLTLRKVYFDNYSLKPLYETWNEYWKNELDMVRTYIFPRGVGVFTYVGKRTITYEELYSKPSLLFMYLCVRATNIWMDMSDATTDEDREKNYKLRNNIPQYVETNYPKLDEEVFKKL